MIDHRRLGRELDLFVSDPLAGAGLPIWLPAGAAARHAVEEYVRELPLRIAELGGMYRSERSGVLGGLSRVRAISLNDAHTFCAPEQVGTEVAEILGLIRAAHAALGVRPAGFRLSLRGSGDKYVGDDAQWTRAEDLLRGALAGVEYAEAPGEAAFYGPKIDIQIVDAAGRESTISTIQVDFDKPERFDLSYTDSDGSRRRPVMLHRSLVGSMERLFAYLIEAHEGAFPAWYAPVQLVVLPVSDGQVDAAADLARRAVDAGLRAEVDAAGSLGARVRDAARRRIPYLGVLGASEAADGALALRLRDGRALAPMPADAALALIGGQVAARAADLLPPG
ncbi:aminoacyl--tRNA ligase-related protein [Micromonospora sp. DT4]|uniref:aminoacyl--tRNA ligase-related protein n=1 Tax=Micromonospora sp. DT4 TaxID=3393438 RepID=UPI003CF1CAB9